MKFKTVCFVLLWSVAGCAHTEKTIDQKLSIEPEVKSSEELGTRARALINANASFTPDQKLKLFDLQKTTHEKLRARRVEGLTVRSLLIQEITSDSYREQEVKVIKNKLKENENKKITVFFQAIDDANQILERESDQQKRLELMRNIADIHERN